MSSSVGKRQRERQRWERAQAKAERRAVRQATGAEETPEQGPRSEAELIADLASLHGALEVGEISPEDFEERRDRIRTELERLSQ